MILFGRRINPTFVEDCDPDRIFESVFEGLEKNLLVRFVCCGYFVIPRSEQGRSADWLEATSVNEKGHHAFFSKWERPCFHISFLFTEQLD